jgi:hypothetical protein
VDLKKLTHNALLLLLLLMVVTAKGSRWG